MASRLEQVKFHVRSDDYFATLATILDLTRQTIKSEKNKNLAPNEAQLERLKNELIFLQNNYKIVKK
ncbi:MAG: hypothetical protein AAB791_01975 [Patescibacteria group bacterium]